MVSPSISRTLRWLAGMQDDDQAEPPQWSGPSMTSDAGYNDPTDAGTLSQPLPPPQPASSAPYQDTYTPDPTPPPAPVPANPISPYVPSYAPVAAQVTAERAPTSDWAGVGQSLLDIGTSAVEGARRGYEAAAPLLGQRPPSTPQEVIDAAAPAPYRAVRAASQIGSEAGGGAGRQAAAELGYAAEPTLGLVVPASVPLVGGADVRFSPQDVGAAAGSVLGDPTTYIGGGAANRAIDVAQAGLARGVTAPVRRALGAVGDWGAENAARVAAADARMAAEGSTQAPGTLGVITGNPLEAATAGRTRVIPPDVADTLDFPVRIPEDPAVIRAIEAAGGRVDPERGVDLGVTRAQSPAGAGRPATRGGVFYEAIPEGGRSTYGDYPDSPTGVGGSQVIPRTPTRFRSPLVLTDAPGSEGGFTEGVERLGLARPAQEARAEARRLVGEAEAQGAHPGDALYESAIAAMRRAHELEQSVPSSAAIYRDTNVARRAGPEGSPERAAALKDLVGRYGGDPALVDDLLAVRGADASESAWAIKENILAHNARARGYDGVLTVQRAASPPWEIISKDPDYIAAAARAEQARQAHGDALMDAEQARKRVGMQPGDKNWQEIVSNLDAARKAGQEIPVWLETRVNSLSEVEQRLAALKAEQDAALQAATEARDRLWDKHGATITELADFREGANPTPGTARVPAEVEAAYQAAAARSTAATARMQEVQDALEAADPSRGGSMDAYRRVYEGVAATKQEIADAQRQWTVAFNALQDALEGPPGPPGYTLRSDIPRRGGETVAPGMAGTLPPGTSPDRLASVNRVLGQGLASSVSGGVGAQVNQELNPDDPYAGLKGFAAGALVPPLAARGGMALARRAGRSAELGSAARIGLGDVPPSRLREPMLPGTGDIVARRPVPLPAAVGDAAAQAEMRGAGTALPGLESEARARFEPVRESVPGATPAEAAAAQAEMRATGTPELAGVPPPKGPSFWEWLKTFGYSGMLGPTTAASQTVGGAVQTGLAVEKAIARAVAEGRPGSAGRIVGASVRAVPEGFRSLFEVMSGGQADAGISAAWSGGTARMADRVTNPIGKAAARALDYSTTLWTQAPDAFFSPMFRAIGEREAAEQIAQRTGASADQLMTEAAAARAAGTRAGTSEAQDVMDAGKKLSDDLGFRGEPGTVGKKLAALASRDDGIGFFANFLLPFPAMTARSLKATGRLIPGVGEVIGRREGRDTFERLHDQMVGSMGLAAMGYYATQGGITGSGPADQGVRDRLVAEGWQGHSVLVPGVGYLPTRYFQQWAPILDAVGEVHDAYAYGKQGVDKGAVLGDAASRLGKLATDQVGLSQLNDLLQVLDGSQSSSQGAGFVARSLSRYIPFGATLRQAASVMDPTARKPEGRRPDELVPATSFMQNIAQGLPWFRGYVPERQDVLGRPLPNPQRGLQPALRAHPMLRAFERAGVAVGDPPETLKNPATERDIRLTAAQQARWRTAYGRALRSGWADNGSPTDKETLGSVRSKARDEADALVLGR